MKYHINLSTLIQYIHLSIFTFFLVSQKSICVDPYYEACATRQCGTHNISYPFYIQNLHQPFCGYPGFEINCTTNGNPIIHIPENDYIVEQIFYINNSLRVYNAAVLGSNNGCFPDIRNVTLESNQFNFGNVSELVLLSNCSAAAPGERVSRYRVGCEGENGGGWGLAMFGGDRNLRAGMDECNVNVVVPVEVDGGGGGGEGVVVDYEELLRRGFVLNWTLGDCSMCEESGGRCGFNYSTYHFRCFCPDRPHIVHCPSTSRSRSKLVIEVATGTSAAVVAITIVLFCYFWMKNPSFKSMICWNKKTKDHEDIEALLKKYGPLSPERYRYSDIKKMTNSFRDKLGQGGYGDVYKGKLQDGRLVAVKILKESKGNGEEFVNEVASISRTSHINIVTLLGFCFEGPKRALIYEFMPNGSLEKFIYNEKSLVIRQLGWETLYQIALGIGQGLEYLHRGCNTRILHFDIKPHNILLDEEFSPKISDFGLAKLCPEKGSVVSMSGMRGTPGYIAPEVFSRNFGGVSHKSDVYSYGMMILEMVGGTNNPDEGVDQSSEKYFPDWIYKRLELDEEIGVNGITNGEESENERKMIIVGLWCIQTDPSNRPSMRRVLDMLEGSLESLQIPLRPILVSLSKHQTDSSATESM